MNAAANAGRLAGTVAIVTGGASGIGAATCTRLVSEGAAVAVVDRDLAGAERVAAALPGAIAIGVDITNSGAVNDMVACVVSEFGGVDLLANVAGIDDPAIKNAVAERRAAGEPLDITRQLSDESWHRVRAINLDGAFFCIRAVLPFMTTRHSGSIVNMASIAGVAGNAGNPHYSAAKAGLIGLTRSLAREVAGQGVRVNAIAPGPVDTPMFRRSVSTGNVPNLPIGRAARPEEIADIVLFLASSESSYVTGAVINADGAVSIL